MREFLSNGRIGTLPRPARILYTAFCALTAAGLLSAVPLYDGIVDFGVRTTPAELYQHLIAYYHPPAGQRAETYRRLLETTHFHLFSMPLLLLVLGHLFLLCGVSARAKIGWPAAAVAATAVHLFAPWGIYLAGSSLGLLYPISAGAMLLSYGVMLGVPVYQMWRAAPPETPRAAPSPPAT